MKIWIASTNCSNISTFFLTAMGMVHNYKGMEWFYNIYSYFYCRGAEILQKSRSYLEILGAWRVIRSKFNTKDPQTLGATIKNLVATQIWCREFVHPCSIL
jgi:hypothetical protein